MSDDRVRKIWNKKGPSTEPWCTPVLIHPLLDFASKDTYTVEKEIIILMIKHCLNATEETRS